MDTNHRARGRDRARRSRAVVQGLAVAVSAWAAVAPLQERAYAEAPSSTSAVSSLVPARLLESRSGEVTVDGVSQGIGRVAAGSTVQVKVAGRGGVPVNASAVMLNVTVVGPDRAGYATVFPCGSALPKASNLNFGPGDVVPNAVLSAVGSNGSVCIYTSATTDLVADVNAAFVTPSGQPSSSGSTTVVASGEGVTGSSTAGALPSAGGLGTVGDPIPAGDSASVPDPATDGLVNPDPSFALLARNSGRSGSGVQTEAFTGERYYAIDDSYYASSVSPAIGRLVMWRQVNGQWYRWSSCSGTVVGRTMVLTADHCLRTTDGIAYDAYTFIPGLRGASEPYGEWVAPGNRAYFSTYQNQYRGTNIMTLFDYAIIKFDPSYNGGKSLGDATGSFPIYQGGASVTTKVTVGYPVEGYFNDANGGWCDADSSWCYPYVCQSSDGSTVELGNGWRLMGYGCNGNGGISGGGVFGVVGGRWYVISVNSIGGFVLDRNNNACAVRTQCSWYMRNLWGTEFKAGYFDSFYQAVAAL